MTKYAQFLETAKETLGDQGFVDATDAAEFLTDITGTGLSCLFVARPSNTEQVARIVSLCHETGVAIVPQGGNSNVCHMAVPTEDKPTILLSLSRMTRILDINAARCTATVEAGCIMEVLQEAVAAEALVFAPDWGAHSASKSCWRTDASGTGCAH